MSYEKHLERMNLLSQQYTKNKILVNGCISYEGCREATELEIAAIKAWNKTNYEVWLKANDFVFIGEGQCSKVFVDKSKSFVVKIIKEDGIKINYNCYFELYKYAPHQTGYSSRESINDSFITLREVFLKHILYPTLISEDYQCCIQDYMEHNEEKIVDYFKQFDNISVLGPKNNILWSNKENKAQIIDIW